MPLRQPVVQSLKAVAEATGVDEMFTKALPSGVRVRWGVLAGVDQTTRPTRIEVGALHGTAWYVMKCLQPAALGEAVTVEGEVVLPGDFRVGCRVIGATTSDKLEFYAYGTILPLTTAEE